MSFNKIELIQGIFIRITHIEKWNEFKKLAHDIFPNLQVITDATCNYDRANNFNYKIKLHLDGDVVDFEDEISICSLLNFMHKNYIIKIGNDYDEVINIVI